jgi:hypothetical protein
MKRLALIAVVLGIALRALACAAHDAPRGDVLLDVGVARSLSSGEGFASGFTRGVVRVPGDDPVPPQGLADQHPPLWPLIGAVLTPLAGSPFAALKLASFLAGLAVLLLMVRIVDRLTEDVNGVPDGMGPLAAGVVALCFVAVDSSGNGSLYALQAALVLALVELLARPKVRVVLAGVVLGALILLNHQTLVLLPLPLLVLVLAPSKEGRGPATRQGLMVCAVALLCQLPWWLRNHGAFGDPFHSVNGLYLSYWAGGAVSFAVEQGQAVVRVGDVGLVALARAMLGFARMNALYLLVAGLVVLPGLLAVGLGSLPSSVVTALARADRRRLGLVLSLAALSAVALLWPAAKLRYLVALVPLVTALGLEGMVRARTSLDRVGGCLAAVLWLGAVVFTRDDLTSDGPDARPDRFLLLAVGGAVLFIAPLVSWLVGQARGGRLILTCGLPAMGLGALLVVADPDLGTGTAYHGTWFLQDAFGQDAEARDAERARLLGFARTAALGNGMETLAGPVDLLAWERPALVELPPLVGEQLEASVDALVAGGLVDGVVLVSEGPARGGAAAVGLSLWPLASWGGGDGRPWVGLYAVDP